MKGESEMQEEYTANCMMVAKPETVGKLFGVELAKDDYTISLE